MIRAALIALIVLAGPALAQDSAQPPGVDLPAAAPKLSPAEARADSLDKLFARLRTAPTPEDAKKVETEIWKLWMEQDSPTAELLLTQASVAMGESAPGPALKILNELIAARPDIPEAWNKRATLYFMIGRYDDSIADIQKVLDLEPRHFGALSGWGMILKAQGKDLEALTVFKSALAINPQMPGAKAAVEDIERTSRGI